LGGRGRRLRWSAKPTQSSPSSFPSTFSSHFLAHLELIADPSPPRQEVEERRKGLAGALSAYLPFEQVGQERGRRRSRGGTSIFYHHHDTHSHSVLSLTICFTAPWCASPPSYLSRPCPPAKTGEATSWKTAPLLGAGLRIIKADIELHRPFGQCEVLLQNCHSLACSRDQVQLRACPSDSAPSSIRCSCAAPESLAPRRDKRSDNRAPFHSNSRQTAFVTHTSALLSRARVSLSALISRELRHWRCSNLARMWDTHEASDSLLTRIRTQTVCEMTRTLAQLVSAAEKHCFGSRSACSKGN